MHAYRSHTCADLTADHCEHSDRNRPQPADRPTDCPADSEAGDLTSHNVADAVSGGEALRVAVLVLSLLAPRFDLC